MEHFYYKTAVVYGAMRKLAAAQVEEAAAAAAGESVGYVMVMVSVRSMRARLYTSPCASRLPYR